MLGTASMIAARNSAGDWWALGLVLYYMKEGELSKYSLLTEDPEPDLNKWIRLIAKMHKAARKFKLKDWDKDFFGTVIKLLLAPDPRDRTGNISHIYDKLMEKAKALDIPFPK